MIRSNINTFELGENYKSVEKWLEDNSDSSYHNGNGSSTYQLKNGESTIKIDRLYKELIFIGRSKIPKSLEERLKN